MASKSLAHDFKGLSLAAIILGAWLCSLAFGLELELGSYHPVLIALFVAFKAFLHTGLFIIAHDSMHNSLLAGKPEANRRIGSLMLFLYAGLEFDLCQRNHKLHHQFAETKNDPDFSPDNGASIASWYVHFIGNYIHPSQLIKLMIGWSMIYWLASTVNASPFDNVLTFCVLPLVLSSLQLFIVGTWLPHRHGTDAPKSPTPRSLSLNPVVSFAACYHFGYHREHHESPATPWFELPWLNLANKAA
ncbi:MULTISPECIES: beta-carotene ketolase [unclassified Synechococcus]|uniref:beta-carotene ketolase n=1 Tax=unclassified Synechococcus TaxID=2626047 RepID=UPI0000690E8C|nr:MULTISPECIES: beta-carotene ketolase [unclassified Synechococcus]EAQ68831.1 possible beta-carotene ketolase [Synechococcus sp. RS9917]